LNGKTPQTFVIVTLILFLSSARLSAIAYAEDSEKYKCYSHEFNGLLVQIEATVSVWPGNNINMTIRAEATQANIHIRRIHMNVSSLEKGRHKTLLNSTTFLEDVHLNLLKFEETSYAVLIPGDTSPGWLYGEVQYSWSIEGDEYLSDEFDGFPTSYVLNKPYEDLRQDFEELNNFLYDLHANFTSLKANYTDLQEEHLRLVGSQIAQNNATGLMYLFLATTGIFVLTTILLMAKRPKAATW